MANRYDTKIAFMFVDLDKFKYVNDNYDLIDRIDLLQKVLSNHNIKYHL